MKKCFTLFCLLTIALYAYAQNPKTGKWFRLEYDKYVSYKYYVSYHKSPEGFTTVYKIANPRITVTAIHDTANRKITVNVEETGGGILAQINQQEYNYSELSLKLFGIKGSYRILGGDRIPNQLALKFVSSKYDYVNVISVLGDYQTHNIEFFCF